MGRDANQVRFAVDERLVVPEQRFEAVDGEVHFVSPADPPHATCHSRLSALVELHVGEAWIAASDMLTRTGAKSDFAPDASVYPKAPDPTTNGRQLEELAFEVVSTESLAHASRKAKLLHDRGVRRIFAIDVSRRRGLEWSAATDAWKMLASDAFIEDRTLVAPLPIGALVGAASVDDAVAKALLAKKNAVLQAELDERFAAGRAEGMDAGRAEGVEVGRAEGVEVGRAAGYADAVISLLEVRGIELDETLRRRIRSEKDIQRLLDWLRRAATVARVDEL